MLGVDASVVDQQRHLGGEIVLGGIPQLGPVVRGGDIASGKGQNIALT